MSDAAAKRKHPPGLYVLFSTEAAERFSFYTMRALLVLYLTTVIYVGQYTASPEKGEEIRGMIETAPIEAIARPLGDLNRDQQAALADALGVAPVTAPNNREQSEKRWQETTAKLEPIWREAIATDLAGQVTTAMTDLRTDLDALYASAVPSVTTNSAPFSQWMIKSIIRRVIRDEALALYGLYLLLVYTSGLLGGYFADKILGSRKAILMGGIVMCGGLFVMGIPGSAPLYYGLGLIIAGNGFFKPNISTIVSGLYEERDPRRDGAFTIFYMGINLGAFLAVFGAGVAESVAKTQEWGWNIGFVIAAVGMLLSLGLFLWGQRHLGTAGFPPGREVTEETRLTGRDFRDVAIWTAGVSSVVVLLVFIWGFVGPVWNSLPSWAQLLIGAGAIAGALWGAFGRKKKANPTAAAPLNREEWQRVAVIIILSIFVIFFWMGFEQAGGTMNLFAYEQTDRHIFDWEMPATYFQGFNPVFIFILAPLFSMLWNWNDRKSWGLTTPSKMGVGLILLGGGFGVMYFGQEAAISHGQASMLWLVAVYLVHTIAELCLSPIGLSMVTKLSPVRIVSLMMGVWFFCTAMADYLSGRMEAITHAFGLGLWSTLIGTSVIPGIVLIVLSPLLNKWMHGKG